MRTVTTEQVATHGEARGEQLPEHIEEALGELAGAAKEGIVPLRRGVGLGVLHELMDAEVEEVVGPRGRHDSERQAKRHGQKQSSVTLGARRVAVSRPRVRSADDAHEVPLRTFSHFARRDQLADAVLERMLCGVSTRRFGRAGEPVGEQVEEKERSTSKSSVSREFVARTRENLDVLLQRRLSDVRLAVLMLDGIELKGRTNVVALGITTEGVKVPLGLWEGSTENAAVRDRTARRPRRARPRYFPGRALRDRRVKGASQGAARRAWRADTRPALHPPEGAKRARPSPRARPPAA